MGKVLSVVLRPLYNFNVENRAHRIISKEKPTAAPRFKSDEKFIKELEVNPEINEDLHKKDASLYNRLKDVYVTSETEIFNEDLEKTRALPLNRHIVEDFEFGIKEPDRVSVGRITLRQVLMFLQDHQQNPNEWSIEKISQHYKLQIEDVDNILKYYSIFQIYIPEVENNKAVFAGPLKPEQLQLENSIKNEDKKK